MKTLSQLIKESKEKLDIQDNSINYIPVEDLKKYLTAAEKFISDETKEIVNYLIVNNKHYIDELSDGNKDVENALAYFYDNGPYSDGHKKELYILVRKVVKNGRTMEIPVFQTPEQFHGIIDGKIAPDEVILDLTSEQGRNIIAKRYEKLVYKIALTYKNLADVPFEDLLSAGYLGLTYAMNGYGKKSSKAVKREEITGEETNTDNYKKTTFMTFASYTIRYCILDMIKTEGHLVRIPANQQELERKEKKYNTKHTSVSGDRPISGEEGGKTLFDYVGGMEDSSKASNKKDIERAWDILIKKLIDSGKFSEKVIDCWLHVNEIDGHKKMSNNELAEKYGITSSNITYYCYTVNKYIRTNPQLRAIANELRELYHESKQIAWDEEIDEPVKVVISENNIFDF